MLRPSLRADLALLVALALPTSAVVLGCKKSSATEQGPVDANFGDAPLQKQHVDGGHRGDGGGGDAGHRVDGGGPPVDATQMMGFDATQFRDGNIPEVNRTEVAPPPQTDYCSLPGSVVWQNGLPSVVGGADAGPDAGHAVDLTWMHLPDGFCSHYYATVPETRFMRFSPSGDLFVASPGRSAAGGAVGGLSAIVVLPDDNHDGYADSTLKYMSGLVTTHGLLFYDGSLYYQNGTAFFRTPYTNGDRVASGPGQQVIDVNVYVSPDHWGKAIDVDDNGNIYVTNGGDEGESCSGAELTSNPAFHGGILRIDGSPNGELIARGLRNAYALRCAKGTGVCFGLELARDFVPELGSREKLFPVHLGDNWGFPCCATANTPYSDYTNPAPDCSEVKAEEDSFTIDHTPFGLDFEEGAWTGTFQYRAFVALHGYYGGWYGARVLAIATNPTTGWPDMAVETDAGTTTMTDFATGWDDGRQDHGRPAAVTFAPDGRLFIGDDMNGVILWVAQAKSGT
jgi:glucose/arabinose dehydrogenase